MDKAKFDKTRISVMQPGEALPTITKLVTQEMINSWAKISGDFNPLHVNPSFGKTTFFGTNIAHGPLILSFVIEMLARCFKRYWVSAGRLYDIRLVSPVAPGTEIVVGGKVININDEEGKGKVLHCEIFVKSMDNIQIVTGKCLCRMKKTYND